MATLVATPSVSVQLSAAGVEFAKGGPLSIHVGHFSGTFQPGVPQQVPLLDWNTTLLPAVGNGKPLFELAPAPAPTPASKKSAAPPPSVESGAPGETVVKL